MGVPKSKARNSFTVAKATVVAAVIAGIAALLVALIPLLKKDPAPKDSPPIKNNFANVNAPVLIAEGTGNTSTIIINPTTLPPANVFVSNVIVLPPYLDSPTTAKTETPSVLASPKNDSPTSDGLSKQTVSKDGFAASDVVTMAIVVECPWDVRRTGRYTPGIVAAVEQEFTQAFLNKRYPLVAPERIAAVLQDQDSQSRRDTGLTKAVKASRLLNATHVLVVSVSQLTISEQRRKSITNGRVEKFLDANCRIDSQIIDVKTGATVAAVSHNKNDQNAKSGDDAVPLAASVARRVAEAYPSK